jgi:hypothetical protein
MTGEVICTDLARFRKATGHDIRGILGLSFLDEHVIRVDFDAGELSILRRSPAFAGVEFRLSYNELHLPCINAEVGDGESISFVVDTGMIGKAFSVRARRFDELIDKGRIEVVGPPARVATFEGDVKLRNGRLGHLTLDEYRHAAVSVGEGRENKLGLQLLLRYVVTFDFPDGRLYLKKGKRFDDAECFGWCGMSLIRSDGEPRVEEILQNSPADELGLKAGDEILRIDGRAASSMSLFEIRSILRTEGRRVRVDARSSDGRREVQLRVTGPAGADAKVSKSR